MRTHAGAYSVDDAESWPYRVPLPDTEFEPGQLRFGYSDNLNCAEPEREVSNHFSSIIKKLENAGLAMRLVEVPYDKSFEDCELLFTPDAELSLRLALDQRRDLADPVVVKLAQQAAKMSAVEYAEAELVRNEVRRVFNRLFEQIDCLLTLTQETTANRLDQTPRRMFVALRYLFNMTGQPAISIPAGLSRAGMPIGLQLVCSKGKEDLLLGIAEHFESLLG